MGSPTVVVVENDPDVRERIAQELRELGYSVDEGPCSVDEHGAPVGGQGDQNADLINAGGICIDIPAHRVTVDDRFLALTPREYRLLLFFAKNQDRVFSRKQLLANVWDRDASIGVRTVDVHIRRLRSILEPHQCDDYLQTVRGSGYRFSVTQS